MQQLFRLLLCFGFKRAVDCCLLGFALISLGQRPQFFQRFIVNGAERLFLGQDLAQRRCTRRMSGSSIRSNARLISSTIVSSSIIESPCCCSFKPSPPSRNSLNTSPVRFEATVGLARAHLILLVAIRRDYAI